MEREAAREDDSKLAQPGPLPAAAAVVIVLWVVVAVVGLLYGFAVIISAATEWDGSMPSSADVLPLIPLSLCIGGGMVAVALGMRRRWARRALEILTWTWGLVQASFLLYDISSITNGPHTAQMFDFSGIAVMLDEWALLFLLAFVVTVSVLLRRRSVLDAFETSA